MPQNMTPRQTALVDEPLTVDALKAAMPKRQKHNITPSLVQELNKIVCEPEEREAFRQNLVGYTNVLQDPNVKLNDYIAAVRYVSFKLMGYTNQESWLKTFPDRYQRLIDNGKIDEEDDSFLRSTVACYNRGKLVNTILEQTMVPTWVLNHDLYQKALATQATLMTTAKSEKVRSDAANSLLTHLKQPETVKMKLDVEVKESDEILELKRAALDLVREQRRAIESGANTADEIAAGRIIQGDAERVE